jgi:hypothetical protein
MVARLLLAHSLLERKYTLCVFGTGIAVTSATDCPDFRVTVTVFVYFLLFVTSWDTGIVLEFSNRPHERATNTATHLTHPRHGPGLSRLIEAACQTRTSQCGDAESHAASTCTALRILPLAHTQQPSLLAVLPNLVLSSVPTEHNMSADIVRLRPPRGAAKRSSMRSRANLPDADFNPSAAYRDERPVSWVPEAYQVGVSE